MDRTGILLTKILKPSDFVMENAEAAAQLVRRAVVPIFRSDSRDRPDFEGSGVLMEVGGRHFLISAAHVFERSDNHPFLLSEGFERVPTHHRPFTNILSAGQKRDHDKIDVGFVELTSAEAAALGLESFLRPRHVNVEHMNARRGPLLALGFPGGIQERDDIGKIYRMETAYYVALEATKKGYDSCGVQRSSHLMLKYRRNRLVSASGAGVPEFKGMSGGGVFAFPALATPTPDAPPRLVAIIIERPDCYGPSILTTRIDVVLEGLRVAFPDIAPLVPAGRSLDALTATFAQAT